MLLLDGVAQLACATLVVFGIVSANQEPQKLTWFVSPGLAGASFTLRLP